MSKTNSKVLQQGHLDGFCLLYALSNAYKSLKSPTQPAVKFSENMHDAWSKVISITPSLHAFASGEGSRFSIYTNQADADFKFNYLQQCLNVISERMKKKYEISKIDIENIHDSIGEKSVVIFCFSEKEVISDKGPIADHWVCAVDKSGEDLKLACSWSPYLGKSKNMTAEEMVSSEFNRPYNNIVSMDQISRTTVCENYIYKVKEAIA